MDDRVYTSVPCLYNSTTLSTVRTILCTCTLRKVHKFSNIIIPCWTIPVLQPTDFQLCRMKETAADRTSDKINAAMRSLSARPYINNLTVRSTMHRPRESSSQSCSRSTCRCRAVVGGREVSQPGQAGITGRKEPSSDRSAILGSPSSQKQFTYPATTWATAIGFGVPARHKHVRNDRFRAALLCHLALCTACCRNFLNTSTVRKGSCWGDKKSDVFKHMETVRNRSAG
jgi:hypothetical protein